MTDKAQKTETKTVDPGAKGSKGTTRSRSVDIDLDKRNKLGSVSHIASDATSLQARREEGEGATWLGPPT